MTKRCNIWKDAETSGTDGAARCFPAADGGIGRHWGDEGTLTGGRVRVAGRYVLQRNRRRRRAYRRDEQHQEDAKLSTTVDNLSVKPMTRVMDLPSGSPGLLKPRLSQAVKPCLRPEERRIQTDNESDIGDFTPPLNSPSKKRHSTGVDCRIVGAHSTPLKTAPT